MSFLSRIKELGKSQDREEVQPEALSTEGMVTADGSQQVDTQSSPSTIQPGGNTTTSDSIISEAAPSQFPDDYNETRLNAEAQATPVPGSESQTGLPLIGHLRLDRQQRILGGALADRAPRRAVIWTLAALALVLAAMPLAIDTPWMAVVFFGVLGVASFATVAPLQFAVLEQASGAGQTLASSLNIAAFNLGNALGAGAGSLTLAQGFGLRALGTAALLFTLAGLALALAGHALQRRQVAARCETAA